MTFYHENMEISHHVLVAKSDRRWPKANWIIRQAAAAGATALVLFLNSTAIAHAEVNDNESRKVNCESAGGVVAEVTSATFACLLSGSNDTVAAVVCPEEERCTCTGSACGEFGGPDAIELGSAIAGDPFEVIGALSRAFDGAGQVLSDDQIEVPARLNSAAAHMARAVDASPMGQEAMDIVMSLEGSMLSMSEAIAADDAERLLSEAVKYRTALRELAEGIGDEVGLAFRDNPTVARELGLDQLAPMLYEAIGQADTVLEAIGDQGVSADLPDTIALTFGGTGLQFQNFGSGLGLWTDGSSGIGNPWGDTCTCGETRGNSICVVDSHLLCDTCEWHQRTDS